MTRWQRHHAELKHIINSSIQQDIQIKQDVSKHTDMYLLKPPKKFQHPTGAEEVVITRLRIGHTEATKSRILFRGPPTTCQHCDQTLTIEHILLECTVLRQSRDEYYTADSLKILFGTISEACTVEFLRFFYLIGGLNVRIFSSTHYSNQSPTDWIMNLN